MSFIFNIMTGKLSRGRKYVFVVIVMFISM